MAVLERNKDEVIVRRCIKNYINQFNEDKLFGQFKRYIYEENDFATFIVDYTSIQFLQLEYNEDDDSGIRVTDYKKAQTLEFEVKAYIEIPLYLNSFYEYEAVYNSLLEKLEDDVIERLKNAGDNVVCTVRVVKLNKGGYALKYRVAVDYIYGKLEISDNK